MKQIYFVLIFLALSIPTTLKSQDFIYDDLQEGKKPWTHLRFQNNKDDFQFALVSDRTGGHRKGIFSTAIEKLNLLTPEFVMCVGDLIEGYSKDSMEVNSMWGEFNNVIAKLNPPFFFLPGNHDLSNDMMRNQWLERYGRAYYHFTYKNVLFICMDSNDGDGVTLSDAQVNYVVDALEKNKDVRWTFIFMHHPIWEYSTVNQFEKIEEKLNGRDYTVFAGHTHRYLYKQRQDNNYIVLSTTGGGSELRGPLFGEYDHITWVTFQESSPKIVNLKLDGIIPHDIVDTQTAERARSLIRATNFATLITRDHKGMGFENANVTLLLKNLADKPLKFEGRFFHNHHSDVSVGNISFMVPPNGKKEYKFSVEKLKKIALDDLHPLELHWTIGYEQEKGELPFELAGTKSIHLNENLKNISVNENKIFTDTIYVNLSHDFDDVDIRYTLDGTDPKSNSTKYVGPFSINKSAKFKALVFDSSGFYSDIIEADFQKVEPLKPVKTKRLQKGLSFQYYEGFFKKLPAFDTLTPKKSGIAHDFDVEAIAERENNYAIKYNGFIDIPKSGMYEFFTVSDDGSKLFISGKEVVDNDGSHSARMKKGYVALTKGKHPIEIQYFEDFLGQELRIGYIGPDGVRKLVTFDMLSN